MAYEGGAEAPPGQVVARALVIEDEAAVRANVASALAGSGFSILEASDGIEGLRALVDHLLSLDLLVTDVEMPGLCGEALVRTIRQLGGESDLPIVVFSGSLDPARQERLRAAGADAVVGKGEGAQAVVSAARRLVARRGEGGAAVAPPQPAGRAPAAAEPDLAAPENVPVALARIRVETRPRG